MTEFSVVIPTYNRENKIEAAIESVLKQDGAGEYFKLNEIIVIDDCSTDNTEKVIETFREKEAGQLQKSGTKLIYYRLDRNSGPGKARNVGAEMAKSEFIAFQDSDDLWFPHKLKEMSLFMVENPRADLYSHFYEAELSGGRKMLVDAPAMNDYFEELAKRNLVGAPTVVVKRDAFLSIDGFDEDMRALEDWDFALRFAYEHRIIFVPKVLMEVDLVGEGVSSSAGNYYDARCRLIAKNKKILMERDLFRTAVERLLKNAEEKGILKEVGQILESYLV